MNALPAAPTTVWSLAGRSALVTGGGSGLGLAFAEALAEAGAAVTIADIAADRAEQAAQRLTAAGYNAVGSCINVCDRAALHDAFEAHLARFGGLDSVFCNAGIDSGTGVWNPAGHRNAAGQIDMLADADWDSTIATNLTGVFNTLKEAARVMKAHGIRGSIVVTSSNAAFTVAPMAGTAYMPAKAAVSHLMRSAALELAAWGIRVNAIAPGPFATRIGGGGVIDDPQVRSAWDALIPLGSMASPERIKPLAVFLASDASDYMTGSEVVIDGGMSLGRPIPR